MQSESDNIVDISNLSFGYSAERSVLSGINLRIPRGKIIAIMGQSGCGKTTLLRMMCGALRARSGEVRVFGKLVNEMSNREIFDMRRRVSMLFQFGALFTDMNTFDNVAFQMREHTELPESMIRDLVLMKLHAVGLRGAAQLMPSELSGGMARRVALARAIALDPELILCDEPFAGLDPISLGVIGQLMRNLNEALGTTVVIVTHDVQESLAIVDYVYFVAGGRIIAEGTAEEVRASEVPFVHQFVWGEFDGPVPFHAPATDYREQILGSSAQ